MKSILKFLATVILACIAVTIVMLFAAYLAEATVACESTLPQQLYISFIFIITMIIICVYAVFHVKFAVMNKLQYLQKELLEARSSLNKIQRNVETTKDHTITIYNHTVK